MVKEKDKDTFNSDNQAKREYGAIANEYTKSWMCNLLKNVGFREIKTRNMGQDRDLPHVMFSAEK